MRLTEIKKLAIAGVLAALVGPGSALADTVQSQVKVEKRTEISSTTDPLELTGKIELDATRDDSVVIVDDGGVRYFVESDDHLDDLRGLVGQKVKINYIMPDTDSKVVKVRSFQALDDGDSEIEIDRDDGEIEVDVDRD